MSSPVTAIAREGRLKELDGWRAISVLLVITYHIGSYQYATFTFPHHRVAEFLNDCGPLGVRVFFAISGFVICRLLILEERRCGAVSLRGFYVRRAFRILPPYCLYLATICLLLSFQLIVGTWRVFLIAALFLYDVRSLAIHSWFVGHTWSLAVEEQFYLIFPTLWVLTRGAARRYLFLIIFFVLVAWNLCAAIFDWNGFTTPAVRTGFTCISCGVVMALFESRARAIARALPAVVMAAIALGLLWHPGGYFSLKSAFYDSI
jgi:peptidoglycan/LPS O-acetylase OafA/YrhL